MAVNMKRYFLPPSLGGDVGVGGQTFLIILKIIIKNFLELEILQELLQSRPES